MNIVRLWIRCPDYAVKRGPLLRIVHLLYKHLETDKTTAMVYLVRVRVLKPWRKSDTLLSVAISV
jgi:hypothetical protein